MGCGTLRVLKQEHMPPPPLRMKPSASQVKQEKAKGKKPAGKPPAEEPTMLSKKDKEQKVRTARR